MAEILATMFWSTKPVTAATRCVYQDGDGLGRIGVKSIPAKRCPGGPRPPVRVGPTSCLLVTRSGILRGGILRDDTIADIFASLLRMSRTDRSANKTRPRAAAFTRMNRNMQLPLLVPQWALVYTSCWKPNRQT